MQDKYKTAVASLWTDEKKMQVWVEIELLALQTESKEHYEKAKLALSSAIWMVLAQTVNDEEKKIGHEVEAFVRVLSSYYKTGLWHKGLASSDLVECWFAKAIGDSMALLHEEHANIGMKLQEMARENATKVENGITHGQLAEPLTWGWRILNWAKDWNMSFLPSLANGFPPGKITGAVGTSLTTPEELPKMVARALGINMVEVSTQIAPRVYMNKCLSSVATLAASMEKIANDLRVLFTLERIEVMNMPVGSSSMPHKVNPYELERVIGMCRMIQSMVHCVNTTNADGWLERDMVHSCVEREFLPMIFNHTYYSMKLLHNLIGRVVFMATDIPPKSWSSVKLAHTLKHEDDRVKAREQAVPGFEGKAVGYEKELCGLMTKQIKKHTK